MKKSWKRKAVVLTVIALFFGASIIPSTIGTVANKKTFPNSISRGYPESNR